MLSHLVGAANRADIRRLVVLELERDRLADELSKTKHRLAEQNRELGGAAEQQTKTIRDLTGQLEAARAVAARLRQDQAERGLGALRAQVDRASAALAASRRDVERERQRLAAQLREAQELREQCERQEQEVRALRTECGALEQLLEGTIELSNPCRAGSAVCPAFNLCGRRIVYVGGRSHLIPHFRSLVERAGGTLIHHDGGVEDATGRRNGILTQGDAVLCAMDCVSHDACWRVKHLCKQRTKAFICGVR